LFLIAWGGLLQTAASGVEVYGGVAHSTIHGTARSGPVLGVREHKHNCDSALGISASCEYIERSGDLPISFIGGEGYDPAPVGSGTLSLAYIQPALALRMRIHDWATRPTPYIGVALAVNVRKRLVAPGAPASVWDYLHEISDSDYSCFAGVSLECWGLRADLRYDIGLTDVTVPPRRIGEANIFPESKAKFKTLCLFLAISL